ncbi:MAG: nicotinate-nucleotide adenylyltransferase [Saprospiraceae bacterium]|nr:nicotinate-nucleotide adenylyltransferase [Saprospiraceae bacterium]
MKVGLFFGSFNPIHIGHLIIANFMVDQTELGQVWFVVSPQNPFKEKKSLAKDSERLYMVNIAIEDNPKLRSSSIEFGLPKPSYTIDTLTHLKEKHPQHDFSLIMGGDNLKTFHKWKNFELILRDYYMMVYMRPDYDAGELQSHERVTLFDAPQMHISASYIRRCIASGYSIRYLVPESVYHHIEGSSLYKP